MNNWFKINISWRIFEMLFWLLEFQYSKILATKKYKRNSIIKESFRFSQRCSSGLCSSGMWRYVNGSSVHDVLTEDNDPIWKGQNIWPISQSLTQRHTQKEQRSQTDRQTEFSISLSDFWKAIDKEKDTSYSTSFQLANTFVLQQTIVLLRTFNKNTRILNKCFCTIFAH